MNQKIDYHSKYLKYKKKYLNLKSELDGGRNEVSWKNEPKFDPVYNSKKPELKDMNCQNSELKIFLAEEKYGEKTFYHKDSIWCMDIKSVKLKDLDLIANKHEYFIKTFYPYILKKMFPESSRGSKQFGAFDVKYLELTKITYIKPKVEEYLKDKLIRLEISYEDEGDEPFIKVEWVDGSLDTFDPKKDLSFGFFGKIKEGKLGKHDIDLEKFVKEHIQFVDDFQIKVNEVYKIWVQVLKRQKDEDITAFLIKLKEMWNRTHRFFVSIKK